MNNQSIYPSFNTLVDYVFNQLNDDHEERLQNHLETDETSLQIVENLLAYCQKHQVEKVELLSKIEADRQKIFKEAGIELMADTSIQMTPTQKGYLQKLRDRGVNFWQFIINILIGRQPALSLVAPIMMFIIVVLLLFNAPSMDKKNLHSLPNIPPVIMDEQSEKVFESA